MQLQQPIQPASSLMPPNSGNHDARIVARQFESLFANYMMRALRKTIPENPLMPQSTGEQIFTEMLDKEYASLLANQGNFGLADLIVKEIERHESGETIPFADLQPLRSWQTMRSPSAAFNGPSLPDTLEERLAMFDDLINSASEKYGVDKHLIAAVIAQESSANPLAVSHAGAKGLMQLMDSTASDMGVKSVFNPRDNIMGGTRYLKAMFDRFNNDPERALGAYNAGPSTVERYGGVPPWVETQNYVQRVLFYRDHLKHADESALKE